VKKTTYVCRYYHKSLRGMGCRLLSKPAVQRHLLTAPILSDSPGRITDIIECDAVAASPLAGFRGVWSLNHNWIRIGSTIKYHYSAGDGSDTGSSSSGSNIYLGILWCLYCGKAADVAGTRTRWREGGAAVSATIARVRQYKAKVDVEGELHLTNEFHVVSVTNLIDPIEIEHSDNSNNSSSSRREEGDGSAPYICTSGTTLGGIHLPISGIRPHPSFNAPERLHCEVPLAVKYPHLPHIRIGWICYKDKFAGLHRVYYSLGGEYYTATCIPRFLRLSKDCIMERGIVPHNAEWRDCFSGCLRREILRYENGFMANISGIGSCVISGGLVLVKCDYPEAQDFANGSQNGNFCCRCCKVSKDEVGHHDSVLSSK